MGISLIDIRFIPQTHRIAVNDYYQPSKMREENLDKAPLTLRSGVLLLLRRERNPSEAVRGLSEVGRRGIKM